MATARLTPDARTVRRYVRAYVAAGMEPTPRRVNRQDELLRALDHWSRDDLDDGWHCPCEACAWWKEQVRIHRAERARN